MFLHYKLELLLPHCLLQLQVLLQLFLLQEMLLLLLWLLLLLQQLLLLLGRQPKHLFTGLEPIWSIGSLQSQEVNIRCVLLVAGLTAGRLLLLVGMTTGRLLLVAGLTAGRLLVAGLTASHLLHPCSPGSLQPCGGRWGRHHCSLSLGAG